MYEIINDILQASLILVALVMVIGFIMMLILPEKELKKIFKGDGGSDVNHFEQKKGIGQDAYDRFVQDEVRTAMQKINTGKLKIDE